MDSSFTVESLDKAEGVDKTGQISANQMDRAAKAAVNPVSNGGDLADLIVKDMIPVVAQQIFDAFPSIKNDIGNETMDIKITVTRLDGLNNMLSRAGFSWSTTGNGRGFNLEIQVDSADFTAADADGTGSRVEALQSTIAHEFMHSVMQFAMTDGMSGRKGDAFPEWFKEGTAQLAGGGFPTQWNNSLIAYANQLSGGNDASQDANIKNYLRSHTVDNRPYGHGYLAAAYAGYLANGGGAMTGQNIAAGMDKIFADLMGGKSFRQTIQDRTGMTVGQLKNTVNQGDPALVEFVRQLSYESLGGAGSVITSALNVGGASIIGGGGGTTVRPGATGGSNSVGIQVGAEAGQHITLNLYRMDTAALWLTDVNVRTVEDAGDAIDKIKNAIRYVSYVRSDYGAVQNRLEHTISNLNNIVENTTASESLIRDVDIAEEMVKYSASQVLLQAGQSMLAQANQQPNLILSLLS